MYITRKHQDHLLVQKGLLSTNVPFDVLSTYSGYKPSTLVPPHKALGPFASPKEVTFYQYSPQSYIDVVWTLEKCISTTFLSGLPYVRSDFRHVMKTP